MSNIYVIQATRTHTYQVTVKAQDEVEAIDQMDDWNSDDFEAYEVDAKWDFEVLLGEVNG